MEVEKQYYEMFYSVLFMCFMHSNTNYTLFCFVIVGNKNNLRMVFVKVQFQFFPVSFHEY